MRRPARGFTTTELIVVLSIMGILSGVVVPVLGRLDDMRANAVLTTTIRDIRYAQTRALSGKLRTWVVFDPTNETYALYIEPTSGAGRAGRVPMTDPLSQSSLVRDLNDLSLGQCVLSTVDFGGTLEIEFDSDGVPHDATETKLSADGSIVFSQGSRVTAMAQTGYVELTP